MKVLLFAAGGSLVAFAALFFLMQDAKPAKKADNVPLVTELPTSKKATRDEDPSEPTEKPKPQTSKRQNNFPTIGDAPPAKKMPPPKHLYYTVELTRNRGPIPSRVILNNTKFGSVTIVIIGAEDALGKLFIRSGSYESIPWEIRVVEGVLWVYWNGQEVPPLTSSF